MVAYWSTALSSRAATDVEIENTSGIWSKLKESIQITSYHPCANANVISTKLRDRHGDYYVLKNKEEKTYLRLSSSEYDLWNMMDGELSVQDLIVEYYMKTGNFAHNNIIRLVQQLSQHQMLSEKSVAIWSQIAAKVQSRSWLHRASSPARAILTQRLNINGIDKWISALYKTIGWIFFTRPMTILFVLISIIGFIAYSRLIADPSNVFLGDNLLLSLTTIWILSIIPVVIHELGHALTVKHFGREVPRGGLLLYFGMPAAFVETTDIWLEPRKARLAVTWNGPFTGLILGGAASLFMYLYPDSPYNNLLFKFAGFAYITVFFNVNPLLKLDGYYLLSDALDIASLRERSLAFVKGKLFKKIWRREKFSRDELIFSFFGLLSFIWTFYAIYLAVFFWRTRIQSSVQVLLTGSVPLVTRLLNLLIVAAMGSFIFLISLQLFRAMRNLISRYARSGNLENHRRFALVLMVLSLLLGFGLPILITNYALQLSAGLGLFAGLSSAVMLFSFSKSYWGSPWGTAFYAFVGGVIISALALALRFINDTNTIPQWFQWTSLLLITIGLGAISWSTLDRRAFLIGLSAASLWLLLFTFGLQNPLPLPFTLLSSLLVLAGISSVISLRGSARTPAILLLSMAGVLIVFSWMELSPTLDFAFAGTLLISAGCIHLVYAKMPKLSSPGEVEITSDTRWAVGVSVGILIRRVIAQVFFESGFAGVSRFGKAFGKAMHEHGVDIKISGNIFYDNELPNRSTDELLEVYGLAFDVIYAYICGEFGRRMGTLTFGYGIDLLPWEYREVIAELILSRRQWGLSLSKQLADAQDKRLNLLRRSALFNELTDQEMTDLAAGLKEERFAAGEFVIRQDEIGYKFYLVEYGVASVWQRTADGTDKEVDRLGAGHYFGEVALISDAPRNASIRAETPLTLLSLDRDTFDRLVKKHINLEQQVNTRVGYSWLLRGMPIFDELTGEDIDRLASRLEVEKYPPETVLFHEGDIGDKFYIVASGELSILHEVKDKLVEVSRRGPGDYFGEIALIENRPRTATVMTIEETELLSLKAEYFQEVISSFTHVGETLSMTGSRRLSMLQRVDAGLIPTS